MAALVSGEAVCASSSQMAIARWVDASNAGVGIGVDPSLVWVGAVGTGFIDCFAYLLVYPEAGQHGGGFHFYRGV